MKYSLAFLFLAATATLVVSDPIRDAFDAAKGKVNGKDRQRLAFLNNGSTDQVQRIDNELRDAVQPLINLLVETYPNTKRFNQQLENMKEAIIIFMFDGIRYQFQQKAARLGVSLWDDALYKNMEKIYKTDPVKLLSVLKACEPQWRLIK